MIGLSKSFFSNLAILKNQPFRDTKSMWFFTDFTKHMKFKLYWKSWFSDPFWRSIHIQIFNRVCHFIESKHSQGKSGNCYFMVRNVRLAFTLFFQTKTCTSFFATREIFDLKISDFEKSGRKSYTFSYFSQYRIRFFVWFLKFSIFLEKTCFESLLPLEWTFCQKASFSTFYVLEWRF